MYIYLGTAESRRTIPLAYTLTGEHYLYVVLLDKLASCAMHTREQTLQGILNYLMGHFCRSSKSSLEPCGGPHLMVMLMPEGPLVPEVH